MSTFKFAEWWRPFVAIAALQHVFEERGWMDYEWRMDDSADRFIIRIRPLPLTDNGISIDTEEDTAEMHKLAFGLEPWIYMVRVAALDKFRVLLWRDARSFQRDDAFWLFGYTRPMWVE